MCGTISDTSAEQAKPRESPEHEQHCASRRHRPSAGRKTRFNCMPKKKIQKTAILKTDRTLQAANSTINNHQLSTLTYHDIISSIYFNHLFQPSTPINTYQHLSTLSTPINTYQQHINSASTPHPGSPAAPRRASPRRAAR